MKRPVIYLLIILGCLVPILSTSYAYAVDVVTPACQNADPNNLPTVCKDNASKNCPDPTVPCTDQPIFGPHGILTTIINLLSLALGVIAVFVIIIGGIKFITSSGDPASVTSARNTILYAIIALVVVLAAQAIVRLVLSRL